MANRLQVLNTCQSYHQKDPDMSKFNAISYEQELEAAGVAKAQAAVHAKALGEVMSEVVICSDLHGVENNLRKEIENSEHSVTEQIDASCSKLELKIEHVKIEFRTKIEMLSSRIDSVSGRMESVRDELISRIDGVRTNLEGRSSAIEYELGVQRWLTRIMITLQVGTIAMLAKAFLF
jgi:hypothetical protein